MRLSPRGSEAAEPLLELRAHLRSALGLDWTVETIAAPLRIEICLWSAYSLTAPAVRPAMRKRCSRMTSTKTGTIWTVAAAKSTP